MFWWWHVHRETGAAHVLVVARPPGDGCHPCPAWTSRLTRMGSWRTAPPGRGRLDGFGRPGGGSSTGPGAIVDHLGVDALVPFVRMCPSAGLNPSLLSSPRSHIGGGRHAAASSGTRPRRRRLRPRNGWRQWKWMITRRPAPGPDARAHDPDMRRQASRLRGGARTRTGSRERPNILIIMGDDIGWFNLSAYNRGMMGYETPHIDRIAREGILFTDYYGQQSCTAGRAALMTGQTPLRTGLTKVGIPGAKRGLSDEDPTIAEILQPPGYATGQFGKSGVWIMPS
ncbi:sulfatase-like hydrolase/transferase [Sorangium sp. So ce385]